MCDEQTISSLVGIKLQSRIGEKKYQSLRLLSLKMNKRHSTEENLYSELESLKQEPEAGIYDVPTAIEVISPATKLTSFEESSDQEEDKRKYSTGSENAYHSDTLAVRPMVIIAAVVAAFAFVTAVVTLGLALGIIVSRNNNETSKDLKDRGSIYGK